MRFFIVSLLLVFAIGCGPSEADKAQIYLATKAELELVETQRTELQEILDNLQGHTLAQEARGESISAEDKKRIEEGLEMIGYLKEREDKLRVKMREYSAD